MFIKNNHLPFPAYQAPDCDACTVLAGVIICASGETEDWVYDEENGF